MSQINDAAIVKTQYADTKNLRTRMSLHEKYSVNKMGFKYPKRIWNVYCV